MASNDSIPITKKLASEVQQDAIRAAVRGATYLGTKDGGSRLARLEDADALAAFLSQPSVRAPIYSLPTRINRDTIRAFIETNLDAQKRGDGLLFVTPSESGQIMRYSEVQIWPQWAAGTLAGALDPSLQSQGIGARGAAANFDWMFEVPGLNLICVTGALDNPRTARLLDALGFERKGEILSKRPDGTVRESVVWEIERVAWSNPYL